MHKHKDVLKKEIEQFAHKVADSKDSDFYYNHFTKKKGSEHVPKSLEHIPYMTFDVLTETPLERRLYKDIRMMGKLVYRDKKVLLMTRTMEDIEKESYGVLCKRPLVLFKNRHEGIEKSIWFYEKNILPLISETNHTITSTLAAQYKIDAILGDTESIVRCTPILEKQYGVDEIQHIGIVDTYFNLSFLRTHFPHATLKCTLALPEVGTIGHMCRKSYLDVDTRPVFHPDPLSYVEIIDGEIVISRLVDLPTPIIRYRTELGATQIQKTCQCDGRESFILT